MYRSKGRYLPRSIHGFLGVILGLHRIAFAQQIPPPSYISEPRLAELMSEVSFYVSYDDASMEPDIAADGKALLGAIRRASDVDCPAPQSAAFAPGISRLALRTDRLAGLYAVSGNLNLLSSGAITFWFKPLDWHDDGDDNTRFFNVSVGLVGVQRQAGARNRNGQVTRQELLAGFGQASKGQRTTSVNRYGVVENGKWYFIAFNWAWPSFSISVNGERFITRALPHYPMGVFDEIKTFQLGSRSGAPTLMDEVMVFDRPLELAEVNLIYSTVRQGIALP